MAEYPTWRRRLAAFGILAVAAGALIATSPPPPPRSTLEASFRSSPMLTAAAPRLTGMVTLELSAAALPAATERSRLRLSGTVEFAAGNEHAIRVGVRPLGVAGTSSQSGVLVHTWPIEQLCRVAEPCRREFEVTLELIAPQPGESVPATFDATVRIAYQEVDAIPLGATATWSATAELAPTPAPTAAGS